MTLNDVAAFLMENDRYEILTHSSPDGDTLGSGYALCMALRQKGKKARVVNTDLPKDFEFLDAYVEPMDFEADKIISVDVADENLLGINKEKYQGKIDLCIDHHIRSIVNAPYKYVEGDAAANCEIIYLLLRAMDVSIDKKIADALYTGVSTDTGCFRYSNTTSRTLRIAAELMDMGADVSYINKVMFETKSKLRIELEREIYGSIEYWADGRCAVVCVDIPLKERLGYEDSIDGLAAIPRQIEGVEIGITMNEKEPNLFKISVRADEKVNASEFCARFGGGGHAAAAGCRITGSKAEVKAKLKAAVEALL